MMQFVHSSIHYQVYSHNLFEYVYITLQSSTFRWTERNVPVTHLRPCHLTSHDKMLNSIIVSHCWYSCLRAGHAQDVQCDLSALDRHIFKQFVLGKPVILLEIPQVCSRISNVPVCNDTLTNACVQVTYRKDVYTAITFAHINRNIPQVRKSIVGVQLTYHYKCIYEYNK